jgi:hypothetical protein
MWTPTSLAERTRSDANTAFTDPPKNSFGGGSLSDIKCVGYGYSTSLLHVTHKKYPHYRFGGNSATNFSFPFKVEYTTALDPNGVVLKTLVGEHQFQRV